jgi:hypothetical protein
MILTRPSFDRAYKKLTIQQRERVDVALGKLEQSFGRPHEHAGIGVRSIGHYFECRAGLQLRILFVVRQDLVLVTVGNHDQIARFIKA